MRIFDGARSRLAAAGVAAKDWLKVAELPSWWRQRDKSAQRRAVATRASGFLATLYAWLAFAAWGLEFGFAALWAIRANGELDWTWRVNTAGADLGAWEFAFAAHLLPATLTTLAVAVIVAISVTWIPAYNGLAGMGRGRRGSMLVVGPLCTAIAIMGAIVVQVENTAIDARDAAVVEQQAGQDRSSIERQIARIEGQLASMRDRTKTNEYAALAATVGAQEYRELYASPAALAAERDPARRRLLERALGAAVRADGLEADLADLEEDLRTAPTEAAVRSTTHEVRTDYIVSGVQWISDNRIVLLGVTLSLIGLLCLWWAQGLREANALFDPDAAHKEAMEAVEEAASQNAASNEEEKRDTLDELDLPALADWRGDVDEEFDLKHVMVDEAGRRLKRVAGHWRVDDGAPKASSSDRRRAEPAAPPADDHAGEAEEAAAGDDVEELMRKMTGGAQTPAEEEVS